MKICLGMWLLITLLAISPAQGATLTVTNGNDDGEGSLRRAIADAVSGDTILFQGVTTVTLTSGQLVIEKDLTIDGGSGVAIERSLDPGTVNFRIFFINGDVTVRIYNTKISNGVSPDGMNGTIAESGGNGEKGGGIYIDGTLILKNCTVSNNVSGRGGEGKDRGIFEEDFCDECCKGGKGGDGGGIYVNGTLVLENCTVSNNVSGQGGNGGGIGDNYFHDENCEGGKGGNGGGIYLDGILTLNLNFATKANILI